VRVNAPSWRNLLANSRLYSIPLAELSTTGWTNSVGTIAAGQGTDSLERSATGTLMYAATASGGVTTCYQNVQLSGFPVSRMAAVLHFYYRNLSGDAGDTVTVQIQPIDATGTLIDSATSSGALAGSATLWTRSSLTIAAVPSTATGVRVTITFTAVGGGDTAPSSAVAGLVLNAGQIGAQLLANPTFDTAAGPTWTVDATSGKGVPANNTEWGDLLTAAGTSGTCRHLWLMQEASGNLADSISPAADFEYIGGTITYADTIAGWTRKGPRFTSTASAFRNLDADLPTPNATSFLVFMLFKKNATPGANRSIWAIGLDATSGNYINLSLGSDDKLYLRDGATAIGTGVSTYGTSVIPIIIRHDRTNSVQAIYTESEKIVATYNATDANEIMRIGDSSLNSPDMNILYSALITGAAAEAGHATAKAMLQQGGWSPGWTP
jgi:hypothetical protein